MIDTEEAGWRAHLHHLGREGVCVLGLKPQGARTTVMVHATLLPIVKMVQGLGVETLSSVLRLQPFPGHQRHIQNLLALGREGPG